MFLYELAIELGVKSADLVDAARALGLGDLSAADQLDAAQVAALRNHVALNPIVRPEPGAAPPPLPAPQTGPLMAAPPAPGGPSAPSAPASWGPPTPPAPPPTWGPPGPGGPAAPAPPAGGAPTFQAPPMAFAPQPPGAPGGDAPLPPSPPTFDGLPTLAGPIPPPPPPGAGGPAMPGAPGMPGAPAPMPAGPGGLTRQQMVIIGVVIALVLGLFAFMVLNTGPDKAKQEALKAQEAKAEKTLSTYVPPTVETTTSTTEATTTTVDEQAPRDTTKFCDGFRRVSVFELKVMAGELEKDYAKLQATVAAERPAWEQAVKDVSAGAAPRLDDAIRHYVATYHNLLDAIAQSGSWSEVLDKVGPQLTDVVDWASGLNAEARSRCA